MKYFPSKYAQFFFALLVLFCSNTFLEAQVAQKIETREVDLKGCVQMYRQKQFVISDKETYLQNIRRDAQKDVCLENAENLDFEKYLFLGIQINSGYCRTPHGLEYQTVRDNSKKQYILKISYTDPQGQVCRALSQYDLWVSVPKLPEDFEVSFEIKAIAPEP